MKTTKIKIKNLFGIKETELGNESVEITGTNGTGKTSVIDAIKYGLMNKSDREYIIKKGETEGEIIIETDTGLTINRKKRAEQSDYKSVKENGREVQSPETLLRQIFTPLQLNPVEFTMMSKQDQNRTILDLIDFDWDLNWIREKFGEIPSGVNYEQNILQVLNDIQAESGDYFKERQDINRDLRNKRAFISDIAKDIPIDYQAEYWERFDIGEKYRELEAVRAENSKIERARAFKDSYDNKVRGLQADREIQMSELERSITRERENLSTEIERLKSEIRFKEQERNGLQTKFEDKKAVIESQFNENIAKLDSDIQIADKYIGKEMLDCSELESEIEEAEEMRKHLNEYKRMKQMQADAENLNKLSEELTRKIELARNLPGEILKTASIPIEGFTVENGIPLINGLPVSNLSEGEQLSLCVDIALSKPNAMQIILIDGAEKLSDENRQRLYEKCKEKGLQFIATRTTNDSEMEVHYI